LAGSDSLIHEFLETLFLPSQLPERERYKVAAYKRSEPSGPNDVRSRHYPVLRRGGTAAAVAGGGGLVLDAA
jgi:hypothetical protein